MDLGCRLDQILQVGPRQEVPQVDEFAVVGVFNVDDTPSVLASPDRLAVNDHVTL